MKRVLVMGCPGCGKSTFSRRLRDITGLPLVPLDSIWWQPDTSHLTEEEFRPLLQIELEKDSWIIDGNFPLSAEVRLRYCDTVLLMDYPLEMCIQGILQRRGKPRPDMPFAQAFEDDEFLDYVRNYHANVHPHLMELVDQARNHAEVTIFRTRQDAEDYLAALEAKIKGEKR